eukprot:TRINITY_DN31_c0_g1_i1.p1 TRINITY_DN31_c0_g1~~TRINITY_DN31_c0_g1_i1.p1  ORF type:complete len:962 (+),score=384.49 TRINITY_DN31_c0_g1_i1:127-3012(+)
MSTPTKKIDEDHVDATGTHEDRSQWGCLDRVSHTVHRGMEDCFGIITKFIVTWPKLTVLATVILTIGLLQGAWKFEQETDGRKLFAPDNSRAVDEEDYVVEYFGYESRVATIFFIAKEDNVLTADSMRLLLSAHQHITTSLSEESYGEVLSYEATCARTQRTNITSPCKRAKSPLTLWDHSPLLMANLTDEMVMESINDESQWREMEPAGPSVMYYLSKTGLVSEGGRIVKAKAVRMQLTFKNQRGDKYDGRDEDYESEHFEMQMVRYIVDVFRPIAHKAGIEVEIQTGAEEDEAGESAMDDDMALLPLGYIMMVFYACFVLGRMRPKYSHAALGVVSVLSVGMSTLSAYGLCWIIGLAFNTLTQLLVLVLLGVGIDDTFVIMDSWWDHSHAPDMKTRMIRAVRHAGPAITVTSVTDLVAFLAGSATDIPALKVFCYYACIGITFIFVYQSTMFVACAYLDSLRQEAGRRDFFCCLKVEDHDGWVGQCCVDQPGADRQPDNEGGDAPQPFNESNRGLLHYVTGELMPRYVLATWVGKGVIFAISAGFLTAACIGLPEVTMNYNNEWFVPDGHRYQDVMETRNDYFEGNTLPLNIYTKKLEYPTYEVQMQIEDIATAVNGNRWITKGSVNSWLRSFTSWVNETSPANIDTTTHAGRTLVKTPVFYPLLKEYLGHGGPRQAVQYRAEMAWSEGGQDDAASVILTARMQAVVIAGPLQVGTDAVDCMDDLRDLLDPLDAFAYHWVYLFWESYKIFIPEITKNVSIAAACVLVLVAVLEANLLIGVFVLITIGLVDICLIGFMPWLDVEVNGVSVVCIVLAIGLAVDYSVHVAGAFLKVSAESIEGGPSGRTQRAAFALWKMGPAVVNGAISTFLAIAPLVIAKSYAFKVFFRMFFMIIFFGLWFGIMTLPCILSICGPAANPAAHRLEDQPWTNPLSPDFKTAIPPAVSDSSSTQEMEEPEQQV